MKASFLYQLSNVTGAISYDWVRLSVDGERNEIYVANTSDRSVSVFSESGMEIYTFGEDLGIVSDIAVRDDGALIVLSQGNDTARALLLCNYRGERVSPLAIRNLPPEFAEFTPDRIVYRKGRLYLADRGAMKIVVTDRDGIFEKGYDIAGRMGLKERKRAETGIVGFSVDGEGNILFTVPVLFVAYRLSADGTMSSFGEPGVSPGKFNVVGGVAADERGSIFVADTLRCVVMIFDRELRFLKEFGYRGLEPGSLIAPMELAADGNGRVYVSQSANRGVSVYRLTYD